MYKLKINIFFNYETIFFILMKQKLLEDKNNINIHF